MPLPEAKSFRLIKRRSEGTGQETIFSDYRSVDGEMVPFVFVIQGDDGRVVARVQEVKFNTSYPPVHISPPQRSLKGRKTWRLVATC